MPISPRCHGSMMKLQIDKFRSKMKRDLEVEVEVAYADEPPPGIRVEEVDVDEPLNTDLYLLLRRSSKYLILDLCFMFGFQ